MLYYTGDFETSTNPDDCRVWAFATCEIDETEHFNYGNSIDDFIHWCENQDNPRVYFHRLEFDGEFIIHWCLRNGFEHLKKEYDEDMNLKLESPRTQTFKTLISDMGVFYCMTIYFSVKGKHTKKVDFYNSLRVLPFSVEKIAEDFKLPISKLKLDYHEYRAPGHILTDHEIAYIRNDVTIMALALAELFKNNLTHMTVGSNALSNYREMIGFRRFTKLFPEPEYYRDIKQSYKGGFCFLQGAYANKVLHEMIGLDVNSLYPSVMRYSILPYGEGVFYDGQYQKSAIYPLYIQTLKCQFELKPNHIPTIQLKNNGAFSPTEYVKSSQDEIITLCLTSVDLDLFLSHYDVFNVTYINGWKFRAYRGAFDEYVDYWVSQKTQAKMDGNGAMYVITKLMLNSLYGKFATSDRAQSKIPYLDKKGIVKYQLSEEETKHTLYLPVGTFITAWARYKTITAAQKLYHRFVYADTDSLHLLGVMDKEITDALEIDDYKLGAWKHETNIDTAKFVRQKTYIEYIAQPNGKPWKSGELLEWKITCAGMPKSCHGEVDIDNFKVGAKYSGKKRPKRVYGGIVLVDTDFTMKGK